MSRQLQLHQISFQHFNSGVDPSRQKYSMVISTLDGESSQYWEILRPSTLWQFLILWSLFSMYFHTRQKQVVTTNFPYLREARGYAIVCCVTLTSLLSAFIKDELVTDGSMCGF